MMKTVAVTLPIAAVAIVAWAMLNARGDDPSQVPPAGSSSPSAATASTDAGAGVQAAGTPTIVFPETSYDFGEVVQGASVSHTFVVRNAGDGPLKLIEARGS